jgi:hypothetical protein
VFLGCKADWLLYRHDQQMSVSVETSPRMTSRKNEGRS